MSEFKKLNAVYDADGKPLDTSKDDEEVESKYTREPLIVTCKYCSNKVLTEVEHETTWTGIFFGLVLLMIFNVYSIPLILLLIPLTQQTSHRCPSCLNVIGTCNYYDVLSFSDKVLSFTIGTFAILISKKHLLGMFVFALISTTFMYFFLHFEVSGKNFIPDEWKDFSKFCSPQEFAKKSKQAKIYCHKYRYADVSWDGYVVRIDYDNTFFGKHVLSILIKMNKEDLSEDGDLYLKFDQHFYSEVKDIIFNLNRGDHLSFNATFINEGDGHHSPYLEAFGLDASDDSKIDISPHIHHTGRYSLDKEVETHADHQLHKNESLYGDLEGFVVDEDVNLEKQVETSH